ncbi:hypothetical protein CKM354_001159000 [Cercospora kikuchii]|uniref:F-box domain-containing protein n=1 Tax=Cercospora kikuchii TaxID=84275 RepID=A0A9P3CTD5_9PEZI|nr:uncharacterized protein CKM354_001159000 [Cercospora kikuchii]GIZ48536.1 hypothetical protein CKM354_001159000 [Cercospora kikuchii]
MSATAAAQVLDTIELLETILLDLPIGDALRAQQVCELWHATIAGSIKLQRALFLRPLLATFSHHSDKLGRNIPSISLSTPCYQVLSETNTYKTLIPRIIDVESSLSAAQLDMSSIMSQLISHTALNESSSLQNMLLTQPALDSVTFFSNYRHKTFARPGEHQMQFYADNDDDDDSPNLASGDFEPFQSSPGVKYICGKQFGFGAVKLQRAGGVSVQDLLSAMRVERLRFEEAKERGEGLKMALVGGAIQTLQTVLNFWEHIQSAQEMKRARMAMSEKCKDAV